MAISYHFVSSSRPSPPADEVAQIRFGLPGPVSLSASPSLSAAALRRASELHGKFRGALDSGREVVLVAPDPCGFDTLCAMYLVRRALEGRALRERLAMLANYADAERMGQPISCPIEERLSSVVIAAKRRGRPLEADGYNRLFEDAIRRMDERSLNPAYDGVLNGVEEWRPELDLLRRDAESYRLDRNRASHEVALWNSNEAARVEEALAIDQPKSLLFPRWAWEDVASSLEGRGFPLVLLRTGAKLGVLVNPQAGVPQALERLAMLLERTDPQGKWTLSNSVGVDGEFGEAGLWSAGDSRLDLTALRELVRAQWVETVVNGPVLVSDFPAEPGLPEVDCVEISTGQLLAERAIGRSGAVRDGYFRVVRAPLQPEMRHAMTTALRVQLAELLRPLVESGRSPGGILERIEQADTGFALCGTHGLAIATTSAGDAAADRLQQSVSGLASIALQSTRLGDEPKLPEREQLLERYIALRAASNGPLSRTLQRFLVETRQEQAVEAQLRLWESQLLMREAGALRHSMRKLDRLQSRMNYLGVFVIAACIALVAEYLVKPLMPVNGETLAALGATAVFVASVIGLMEWRRAPKRIQ